MRFWTVERNPKWQKREIQNSMCPHPCVLEVISASAVLFRLQLWPRIQFLSQGMMQHALKSIDSFPWCQRAWVTSLTAEGDPQPASV